VRFYDPDYLWLLMAIPSLMILLLFAAGFRRRAMEKVGRMETVGRLLGGINRQAGDFSILLFFLSLIIIIGALARPQYPGGVEKVEVRGGKIVIALDVSLSMLASDFQPNRLEKAKREIIGLMDKLQAQTIGLVIFAGEAFVQCPPTVDYSAFRLFLDVAEVGIISDTGTNLADAIDKSVRLLDDGSSVDKAVIIFTDGESFEGDARKAASEAAKRDIRIYAIGVGSAAGRPIPIGKDEDAGLKKDQDGEIVISRLNVDELTAIAGEANGKFFRATPGEAELDDIYADMKGLKGEEKEKKYRILYDEKYRWLLLPGIALLSAACFIPRRRKSWYE
jgi:Ca-activated chloride channel family protein